MTDKAEVMRAGLELTDRFMDALNANDAEAMDACMHFPHVRMADSTVSVYEAPGNNPFDLFDRLKAEDDWHRSAGEERALIQFNPVKAHWLLSYTRFRTDDSVIGVYDSLYTLTKLDGRWGIQARSSFGP